LGPSVAELAVFNDGPDALAAGRRVHSNVRETLMLANDLRRLGLPEWLFRELTARPELISCYEGDMSARPLKGSAPCRWLRGSVCTLSALALIVALSAITSHDFGDHYRPGEIGRLNIHYAVLAQPSASQSGKARAIGQIQPRAVLLRGDSAHFAQPPKLQQITQPSLCRLLLRLKLGPRSASEDPSPISI